MTDQLLLLILLAPLALAITVGVLAFADRHARRDIPPILASLGWAELRVPRFSLTKPSFSGTVSGMPVALDYSERSKSTPHQATMIVPIAASGSLVISARGSGTRIHQGDMKKPRTGMRELIVRDLDAQTNDRKLARLLVFDQLFMTELRNLFEDFPGVIVISPGEVRVRNWIQLEPNASALENLADTHAPAHRLAALLPKQWAITHRLVTLLGQTVQRDDAEISA